MLLDIPSTIPTPVALAIGGAGLIAGLVWMRVALRDKAAQTRRHMEISVHYGTRGDTALAKMRAIDTPTMAIDASELRAATATRLEKLRDWAHDLGDQAKEAVRPEPAPRDWADGEMTAAFNKIVEGTGWERPAEASPVASPAPAQVAPAPSARPAVVMAPRGPQTPPQWETRPAPRRESRIAALSPRERDWSLFGRMPQIELPPFPQRFQMPTQRTSPLVVAARLARLNDPTREYRVKVTQ